MEEEAELQAEGRQNARLRTHGRSYRKSRRRIFFWGGKTRAVSATFRKIPELNIDYFSLRRGSAPGKVQRAGSESNPALNPETSR